jgi:SAM-dependent methyltransferase
VDAREPDDAATPTGLSDEPTFRTDLYRGTAGYYDRFRLPYPETLISDLERRTGASGRGRLLDLACGPGPLAFALLPSFAEVWAVDQEPDMIAVVRSKAAALGDGESDAVPDSDGPDGGRIVAVVSNAEDLDAPAGDFSLIVIGNAFHRLPRDLVARRVYDWLEPGGFLALCWTSGPGEGPLDWQAAYGRLLASWQEALGGGDRVPATWKPAREARPDLEVLAEAGFEVIGKFEFLVPHRWTPSELAGFARSLSTVPAAAVAAQSAAFDHSFAAELGPFLVDGHVTQTVSFAYDLLRKPALALGAGPA